MQLVAEAAQRTPEAPAVLDGSGCVYTYRELMAAASQMAELLGDRGLGRGDFIAVMGHRRAATIPALLGVALTGATFVPCNPHWPRARLSQVLAAIEARCLIGQASDLAVIDMYPPLAPELREVVLLDVDTEQPPLPMHNTTHLDGLTPSDGTPKDDSWDALNPADTGPLVRMVCEQAPSSVLEIGEAPGNLFRGVAPHVDLYAGLYLDSTATQAATGWADEAGHFTDLVCGHVTALEQKISGNYDLAVVTGPILAQAPARIVSRLLDHLASILNRGGTIVITDVKLPNSPDPDGSAVSVDAISKTASLGWTATAVQPLTPRQAQAHDWPDAGNGQCAVVLHRTIHDQSESVSSDLRLRIWTAWHLARRSTTQGLARGLPGDIAYVIFTSGSTGRPKGVSITHTAVVNMLEWMNETFGIGPHDRLLQTTAFSFDLSVYDVFGLLAAGGSIRLASDDDLAEPGRLAQLLLAEPISVWNSAPPVMAWILPFLPTQPTSDIGRTTMRRIFLAGDWIALSVPGTLRQIFPNGQVVSFGGATETTVWSTSFTIDDVDPCWQSIPYGRPMQNARFYVLDTNREPVPIGEAGDLYAAGAVLALGYLGDPAQTAQRFVPDLMVPGERMYDCGDRGLWRPDGELQFLGRVDHQVKIRGYRVELGEIESVMATVEGVREAVVVTVQSDNPWLAGFYTSHQHCPTQPQEDDVLDTLVERLPDYMVPNRVTAMAAMPLTPNGKVDRPALANLMQPQPVGNPPGSGH